MRHLFERHYGLCPYEQDYKYCAICAEKFFICENCGLYSGCLTTDCCDYYVYPIMGIYVYFGAADYKNRRWVYPGTDIKVWTLYRELEKYVEVSEYDMFDMPSPSLWLPPYAREP